MSKNSAAIREHRNLGFASDILTKIHGYFTKNNIVLNKTDKQTFETIALYANVKTGIAYPTIEQLAEKLNLSVSGMKYRIKMLFERLPDEVNGMPLIIKKKNLRFKKTERFANNVYYIPFIGFYEPFKNKEAAQEFTELSWEIYNMCINEKSYIEEVKELQEKLSKNWSDRGFKDMKSFKETFIKMGEKLNLSYNDIVEICISASNSLMDKGIVDLEKYLTKALVNKAKNQRLKEYIANFNAIALEFTNRCLGLCENNYVFYPLIKNIFNSIA